MFTYNDMTIRALATVAPSQVAYEIALSASHPHFRGHFEGFPVLPGVSQVDLVLHLLGHFLLRPVSLTSVQKTKFTALLQPSAVFRATIDYDDDGAARWTFQDECAVYSHGSLTFESTVDAL